MITRNLTKIGETEPNRDKMLKERTGGVWDGPLLSRIAPTSWGLRSETTFNLKINDKRKLEHYCMVQRGTCAKYNNIGVLEKFIRNLSSLADGRRLFLLLPLPCLQLR